MWYKSETYVSLSFLDIQISCYFTNVSSFNKTVYKLHSSSTVSCYCLFSLKIWLCPLFNMYITLIKDCYYTKDGL